MNKTFELKDLFENQKEVDKKFKKHYDLSNDENYLGEKIFHLQVEINELVKLWGGYKYWDNGKNNTDNQLILEKYVDCLQLFLSIGNVINIIPNTNFTNLELKDPYVIFALINKHLSIFNWSSMTISDEDFVYSQYYFGFLHFLTLTNVFVFSWKEIKESYYEKYGAKKYVIK